MSVLSQKLDLKQGQALVMTPQMQQAVKLLQLNNLELAEFIEEEIAQNPLLEKADPPESTDEKEAAPESSEDNKDEVQAEFDEAWTGNEASTDYSSVGSGGSLKFENSDYNFENTLSDTKTLRDHLLEQLHIKCHDAKDRMIGTLLLDRLDESGYIREDHAALAERLGCSIERVENLLKILKTFDPTGVCAADLKECMALQLDEQGKLDAPMQALLDNLDLMAKHELKKLANACGVNETYLQDMIEEIRTLNPKPASDFDHFISQTAVPDVVMQRRPKHMGGGWKVELNTATLPRVLVNNEYYSVVAGSAKTAEDKTYISNQLASANWLAKAMDQRAQTILKTASAIVEQQEAFFLYGLEFLRPLTLKDIAEEIEMHESTVSRVTTNKYIETPRGLFEMKYFFSGGLAGADGQMHSTEAVKAKIKEMIDNEAPKKILSDEAIAKLLNDDGIDVARRTVAKYREALKIPTSAQRRREKKALA